MFGQPQPICLGINETLEEVDVSKFFEIFNRSLFQPSLSLLPHPCHLLLINLSQIFDKYLRYCRKRPFCNGNDCCRVDFDRRPIFADINPCKKYNQQIIIRFHPFLIRI